MQPGVNAYPKISIVTPSYNQGGFIEETILSVIGQGYPNLEYIIIDGGSTDETVDIIRKYEKYLTYWVSEKDNGQSNGINKGFAKATGDILGWLNSDDMYLPATLLYIAKQLNVDSKSICFGNAIHFKEAEGVTSYGSNVADYHANSSLATLDYVIQPSSFWTRSAWETTGPLLEDLHYAFDYEWFLRAQNADVNFMPLAKCLSLYRIHASHKTGTGGAKRQQEISDIYDLYAKRSGILYRKLVSETVNQHTFKNRMLLRMLVKCNRPHSYGDLLKWLKPAQYQDYTAKEINEIRLML